jgi:hypothetical protein
VSDPWGPWFKSGHSNPNGECVKVRYNKTHVQIGDTKNPDAEPITMTRAAFAELIGRVRRGT